VSRRRESIDVVSEVADRVGASASFTQRGDGHNRERIMEMARGE
jgi:hypothetical protein